MLNLKKERNGLYVGGVFQVIEKNRLKCGFIRRKKGYVLVAGKKIVNGGSIEKYNIMFDDVFDQLNRDTELCPWDTTYEPNSARSGLTYGRNHIIIKAQGPY